MMTGAELISADIGERQYAVGELIVRGGVSVIAGLKGRGKSVFVMDMADAVSRGGPFLGRPTDRGQVLYIAPEDDTIELAERYGKLMARHDYEPSDDLDMTDHWPTVEDGGLGRIREWAAACDEPRMVVVDVVTIVHPELVGASYRRVYPMVRRWVDLAHDENIAVVLVTHMYREWRRGDWKSAIVGSIGFTAAAQCVLGIFGQPLSTERSLIYEGKGIGGQIPLTIDGRTMTCEVRDETPVMEPAQAESIRLRLLELVKDHPGLKARELARMMPDRTVDSTVRMLQLMATDGQLAARERRYYLPELKVVAS